MKKTNSRRAFTIAELVIVIAVIAILATVLVPTFGNIIAKARDSVAMQSAKNAYTGYMIENNGDTTEFMLYQSGGHFVTLKNGIPVGVYGNQDDALKALLDDPDTIALNEVDCFELRPTSSDELYRLHRVKVWITAFELNRMQGGVDATSGNLNTTFTNNWYTDIPIPVGAEKVSFLTFKTGATWGSAFMNETDFLTGYYDKTVGGQWITLDIPKDATVFRYGYLYDQIAQNNGWEPFSLVEFSGEHIQADHIATEVDKATIVKHTFSVKVDISAVLGQNSPVMATDYGYITLPKNYTDSGEATRLIIVCHGAGAKLDDYRSTEIKEHSQTYWLDMGYAIMDMYACPTDLANGSELHYGNPSVLECYKKGYDYVMEHYNLKQDGIFVLGSSMGGLSSFQIVQSGQFPVLAQVANCPVIDLFKQAYLNPWTDVVYQRSHISSYFCFSGTTPSFSNTRHQPPQVEIEYFRDNFEKIIPYSPIFTNITTGNAMDIFNWQAVDAITADAKEAALYAQLTATHPCPLLIIHNKDDATVSYRYSEYFAGMLERGGADVTLKLYETGAHNAWNNGPQGYIENYDGNLVQLSESRRLAIEFFRNHEQ